MFTEPNVNLVAQKLAGHLPHPRPVHASTAVKLKS